MSIPPSVPPFPSNVRATFDKNSVVSWIDELNTNQPHAPHPMSGGISPDVTMAYLVQQNLPRTEIPTFDGAPTKWVNFIVARILLGLYVATCW